MNVWWHLPPLPSLISSPVYRFEIGTYDDYTHLPQTFSIGKTLLGNDSEPYEKISSPQHSTGRNRLIHKWTSESLGHILHSNYLPSIESQINSGLINSAIRNLNELLKESCFTKQKSTKARNPKLSEWWDSEMAALKQYKFRSLRYLRKHPSERALQQYKKARNYYRSKIRLKKENNCLQKFQM